MNAQTDVSALFASGLLIVDEKHRTLLDDQRALSLTVVELASGVVEPAHTHPGFEILYGLSGTGHVGVDGVSVPMSTGQVVHVPEGAVKAIANDGDEPLRVLAVLVLDPSRPPFTPVS